jgi:hypothetical protein
VGGGKTGGFSELNTLFYSLRQPAKLPHCRCGELRYAPTLSGLLLRSCTLVQVQHLVVCCSVSIQMKGLLLRSWVKDSAPEWSQMPKPSGLIENNKEAKCLDTAACLLRGARFSIIEQSDVPRDRGAGERERSGL